MRVRRNQVTFHKNIKVQYACVGLSLGSSSYPPDNVVPWTVTESSTGNDG